VDPFPESSFGNKSHKLFGSQGGFIDGRYFRGGQTLAVFLMASAASRREQLCSVGLSLRAQENREGCQQNRNQNYADIFHVIYSFFPCRMLNADSNTGLTSGLHFSRIFSESAFGLCLPILLC
jgi:hypothetical protein